MPRDNLLGIPPGTLGPEMPPLATPRLVRKAWEQLPPSTLLELVRPTSQIIKENVNNDNAIRPNQEPRAVIERNPEPRERATEALEEVGFLVHRGGLTKKPPAYLKDYVCEQISKENSQNEQEFLTNSKNECKERSYLPTQTGKS